MFKEGTRVMVAKESKYHGGKSGTVVGESAYLLHTKILCDGVILSVDDKLITPYELSAINGGYCDPVDVAPEIGTSLMHTLHIKDHAHLLTTKEIKDLKNVLAAIV